MTFFRKYMVLVVGGSIALVLMVIVAVLLFKFRSEYARVQSELSASLSTMEQLHHREPFPSSENVERVRSNLAELDGYLETMLSALSAEQVEPEEMERAAFPAEIERTARRLRSLASEQDVTLAEGMAFGFQRYEAGNLPMQEHVSRLVVQLRTIERLCSLLFESGISRLSSVEREVFDVERTHREVTDVAARRAARVPEEEVAAPTTPVEPEGVEGLYTKESYTLTFLGTDEAVREVLNNIIQNPMLMVVRNIEMRNELAFEGASPASRLSTRLRERGRPRTDARGEPQEREQPLLHEDRVVAGRERVRVRMTLDVYRFKPRVMEGDS